MRGGRTRIPLQGAVEEVKDLLKNEMVRYYGRGKGHEGEGWTPAKTTRRGRART